MAEQTDNTILFSDIVRRLTELGVDGSTLTHVVTYMARDRWLAQCEILAATGHDATPRRSALPLSLRSTATARTAFV